MPPLPTSLFDYDLPPRLIAQVPAARRDQSRLLVVDRATRTLLHRTFADLPEFLRAGDTLFRNNAAVLPARLHARRPTGGQVECFLLRPADGGPTWRCLIKPGKKLPVGATFAHETGAFSGEIVSKETDGSTLVKFTTRDGEPITAVASRLGDVPLPPYIARADDSRRAEDLERYQTVYADRTHPVAVAAPTAGLHFTPEILEKIRARGVKICFVTLHVGAGTFFSVRTENLADHKMHSERFEVGIETVSIVNEAKKNGHRVIAVGTTATRTLETVARQNSGKLNVYAGKTDIFIFPPAQFQIVDALLTNFHLPESTLLMLVSAFAAPGEELRGRELIFQAYAEAIRERYRFFSYGDAMLIL